jgi:hypothetical protein
MHATGNQSAGNNDNEMHKRNARMEENGKVKKNQTIINGNKKL